MDIIVTGRRIEVTEPIKEYATTKVQKLPRYFDRVQEIEVILDKAEHASMTVEVIVHADRSDPFVCHVTGPDLYHLVDEAVNKLERQLTDHKEKLRNRKHPS